MAFVKICPTCRTSNESNEMMCKKCMGDISGIIPVDADKIIEEKKREPELLRENENEASSSTGKKHFIVLLMKDKKKFLVRNGDVVGRKSIGQEFFKDVKTVSRNHVKFVFEEGAWFVQDLNSTNETYLNDLKLNPGEKKKVSNQDKLNLSLSMELRIYLVEK
ncbi:FHA domain-containing protein [bacterium]|nr:FHA domain-containing protein [bacterium]